MIHKRIRLIGCIILAAVTALVVTALHIHKNKRPALPDWVNWQSGDKQVEEIKFHLRNRMLTMEKAGETIFTSDPEIPVQDYLWCDIDHDEAPELLLLCWRIGVFGQDRPFWESQEEENVWTQHIFIYDWEEDHEKPIWMTSELGREIVAWSFDPERRLTLEEGSGLFTTWDWLSWGLTNVDDGIKKVNFLAAGDNLIHMTIVNCANLRGEGYDYLYEPVKELIQNADYAVVNQETPFTEDPSLYHDFPVFGTPVPVGDALVRAGFDGVTFATNHALDQGLEGIDLTRKVFLDQGLDVFGVQGGEQKDYISGQIIEENDIRIGILNYTFATNGIPLPASNPYAVHLLKDQDQVRKDIRQMKEEADFVLVFPHWGTEYEGEPDALQLQWTKLFQEENVDAVIGSHPHVLQPFLELERGDGKTMYLYYSLGNFISAQTDEACILGGLASLTFVKEGENCRIEKADLLPVVTHQTSKIYAVVYPLDAYTKALAEEHQAGMSLWDLHEAYQEVVSQEIQEKYR